MDVIPQEDFTEEQKRYLQGFWSGVTAVRGGAPAAGTKLEAPGTPDGIHRAAQDQFISAGKKLSNEEEAKRKKNALDMWDEIQSHADQGKFPRGTDVFLFKFHGLFHVAPAQDSYMCRLRLPAGIVSSHQLRGLADVASTLAGGYADVTTRANLQLREIKADSATRVLTALHELGIIPRGAGADNIRNVTASPTAGIDPQELIDTAPLAKELHHHILHHRELYGLPRKFNVAFDGGGRISALEDTNDIGFAAVRVGEGREAPPGVYFRVLLGGITGHLDFARDTGLLLRPAECIPLAVAMIRVFIDHGDRTDRKKARLKYLLDAWGHERFVGESLRRAQLGPLRLPVDQCEPRGPVLKHGHTGVQPQKQPGLFHIGVVLPVGRMMSVQMRGLAAIAERHGSGSLRLTVWQNVLIPDVPSERVLAVLEELHTLGLGSSASGLRGGLVACTGSKGCKYAAADTKGHALELARFLEGRVKLDHPINIHFTGCPHSCAQHTIGDIGLLATKVSVGEDLIEGYHVLVGGGYGAEQLIGREICREVPWPALPALIERMLLAYLERRLSSEETFLDYSRRTPTSELRQTIDLVEVKA